MKQDNLSIPTKIYKSSTFPIVLEAVNKLADFIEPTYGKNGKGVLIDFGWESQVLDDAHSVIEELEFEDPFENAVLKFLREATRGTHRRAGDGRATTILLLRSLLNSLNEVKGDAIEVEADLMTALKKATQALRDKATPITTEQELKDVAMVAFHNEKIAEMVAKLVHKVGAEGTVAVEESDLFESTMEIKEGFFYEKGFTSPHMMTDKDEGTAILLEPYILLVDGVVSSFDSIGTLLSNLSSQNKSLLVIGDLDGEALLTTLINKLNGKLLTVVTKGMAGRKGFYDDLAVATGAKVFSPSKGDTVATLEMCGHAEKAIVTETSTTIIGAKGDPEEVAKRVEVLKGEADPDEFSQNERKRRISQLTNGIGVLKVGAPTDGERKYLKKKATDSAHATQLAMKGGVVDGGGNSFIDVANTGNAVIDEALKTPFRVLGCPPATVKDAVEVGIIALESAVSIALRLYRSEGIITMEQ